MIGNLATFCCYLNQIQAIEIRVCLSFYVYWLTEYQLRLLKDIYTLTQFQKQ